jgi:hypothetical protein
MFFIKTVCSKNRFHEKQPVPAFLSFGKYKKNYDPSIPDIGKQGDSCSWSNKPFFLSDGIIL